MDTELNATSEKVKRELANYLGVDLEDIEEDTSLIEDLHMKPTDLTDFTVKLGDLGYDINDLDLTQIETFGELVEALTAHI